MQWALFALISAAFSAAASIYEKKTLYAEGALEFSASLALVNLALSLPFAWFIDFGAIGALPLAVLFFKSVLGAMAFLLVMKGLRDLEISAALPLLVLTPGIVALASFILLGERLSGYEVTGMVLLLAGTYALQAGGVRGMAAPLSALRTSRGHRFILGALGIFSATAVLDKVLLGKLALPPVAFMWFEHLNFALAFTAAYFLSGRTKREMGVVFRRSGALLLTIGVCTIIYRFAQILAVKYGSVALVLSIKRTSVFFAIVIGGRLFRDHNLLSRSIATAVMTAGAILVVMK